jgi:hypothetical protein
MPKQWSVGLSCVTRSAALVADQVSSMSVMDWGQLLRAFQAAIKIPLVAGQLQGTVTIFYP